MGMNFVYSFRICIMNAMLKLLNGILPSLSNQLWLFESSVVVNH